MTALATTQRLILRYFADTDRDAFFTYRNDPQLMKFQSTALPFTKKHLQVFFKQMQERDIHTQNGWVQIALEHQETGEMIGDCAFVNHNKTVEIGITITSKYQKKGYAREAITALINLLLQEEVHRFVAVMDVDNLASKRLFEQLGFRQEGHYLQSYWDQRMQEWRDEYLYALLDHEFMTKTS